MATVATWLKNNDFETLDKPLSEILGIAGDASTDELTVLSGDDLKQFFEATKEDYTGIDIPLRKRIDFKRKVLQLSKEKEALKQQQQHVNVHHDEENRHGNKAKNKDNMSNADIYANYQSFLTTEEKNVLLQFENCQFNCNQKTKQEIPNLIKLNKNKHEINKEKLESIQQLMSNDILLKNTFQRCGKKLNRMKNDFAFMSSKMDNVKDSCIKQWQKQVQEGNVNINNINGSNQDLNSNETTDAEESEYVTDDASGSGRGNRNRKVADKQIDTNEAMIEIVNEFEELNNNEFLTVKKQVNDYYSNFETFLTNIENLCKNFLKSTQIFDVDASMHSSGTLTHREYRFRGSGTAGSRNINDGRSISGSRSGRSGRSVPGSGQELKNDSNNQSDSDEDEDEDDDEYRIHFDSKSGEGDVNIDVGYININQNQNQSSYLQDRNVNNSSYSGNNRKNENTQRGYVGFDSDRSRARSGYGRMHYNYSRSGYSSMRSGNGNNNANSNTNGNRHGNVNVNVNENTTSPDIRHKIGSNSGYSKGASNRGNARQGGGATFSLYNNKLIGTIRDFGNKSSIIQRIIFRGSGHQSRMIISEKGYNRGSHYWKFMLNSSKNGCINSAICQKAVPIVQIGIISLDPSNRQFMNVNKNEPRFMNYFGDLHFYSNSSNSFGFGLRYYIKYNMLSNKMSLGTLGSNHSRVNFYVELAMDKKEHRWNYGDTVTMQLDCDKLTLRFWHNDNTLIGQEIWQNQFHRGTTVLMPKQTYFPAISCLGCDCQASHQGFVVDVLNP